MTRRLFTWILFVGAITAYAFQMPFRVFPSLEPYDNVPVPDDWDVPAELVFGRLMYPSSPYARFERWGGDWREGRTGWTVDYPRADRHVIVMLERLTRIDVRSVEQPVNPDDETDIFNWPWMYVDLPGNWDLTDDQAARVREFLDRGGFLMADNFWGQYEWEGFLDGIAKIYPDRPIMELGDDDTIFHTVFDLEHRFQIPGEWATRRGAMSRDGGTVPYWRAIYDDEGRVAVAITFNSDVGDSWEFADDPSYPEMYSALGMRIGANYVIYAMTH